MNKNLIALSRILIIILLVFTASMSTVLIYIVFCAHLILWKLGELFLLEFIFVTSLLFIVPVAFGLVIREVLKSYKVI